jgi:hypothetical protein
MVRYRRGEDLTEEIFVDAEAAARRFGRTQGVSSANWKSGFRQLPPT